MGGGEEEKGRERKRKRNSMAQLGITILPSQENATSLQCSLIHYYHRHTIWLSPFHSKLVSVIAQGSDVQGKLRIEGVGFIHAHHLEAQITRGAQWNTYTICIACRTTGCRLHVLYLESTCGIIGFTINILTVCLCVCVCDGSGMFVGRD